LLFEKTGAIALMLLGSYDRQPADKIVTTKLATYMSSTSTKVQCYYNCTNAFSTLKWVLEACKFPNILGVKAYY